MGPSYVCLFVGYVEQSLFCSYTGTILHLFLHYIDDCIGAASCSHEELKQFINFTNTFHPKLKFTWTISDTFFSFLDLSISGNHLEIGIYFKTTDSHSYLDYISSHPPSCKNAIPYSQILHRICSQDEANHSRTSQMSLFFKDRNFPPSVVENALDRISCVSHTSALTPPTRNKNKDRIPLVFTYHPINLQIQHIILRHLQSGPTTKDIFPSPPLSAFRRDRSLRNSLVRSTCPSRPTTPGTFPCNHRRFYNCPYTSITGPKKTFHIKQTF
eukprot:g19617.t1